MITKTNNSPIIWTELNVMDYATFDKKDNKIAVLIPINEERYTHLRSNIRSKTAIILFEDNDDIFNHTSILTSDIVMLATKKSIFDENTDIEQEVSHFIPELVDGKWVYSKYDREYNVVGKIDNNALVTQVFTRKELFIYNYGRIGNPDYCVVISIPKSSLNQLTKDGLKRIELNKMRKDNNFSFYGGTKYVNQTY